MKHRLSIERITSALVIASRKGETVTLDKEQLTYGEGAFRPLLTLPPAPSLTRKEQRQRAAAAVRALGGSK